MSQEVATLFVLADRACAGKNFREGEKYFSEILEIYPFNLMALFGKCYSIGMRSTINKNRNREVYENWMEFCKVWFEYVIKNNAEKSIALKENTDQIWQGMNPDTSLFFDHLIDLGQHLFHMERAIREFGPCYNYWEKYLATDLSLRIFSYAHFIKTTNKEREKKEIRHEVIDCAKDFIELCHSSIVINPAWKHEKKYQERKKFIIEQLEIIGIHEDIMSDWPTMIKLQQLAD